MARVAILTPEGIEPVSLQGRTSLHVGPSDGGADISISPNPEGDSYDLHVDDQGRLSLVPARPSYARWIVLWWREATDSPLKVTGFARMVGQSALFDEAAEQLVAVVVQGPADLVWTKGRGIHARTYRAAHEGTGWVVAPADDRIWSS